MARTPQEIYEHHLAALARGDLDAVVEDYAEDAVLITPEGALRGRSAIREAVGGVLGVLAGASWDAYTRIYSDDILFVEWSAVGDKARIRDGIDTFVFRGDAIAVQTVRFTLEPAG